MMVLKLFLPHLMMCIFITEVPMYQYKTACQIKRQPDNFCKRYLTIDADILYYNGISGQNTDNPFTRFVADVVNDMATNYVSG
ncbi:hypothetical protein EAO14_28180 [Klebsiella pneumoniae]|nr:hypothetical protein EAO14_28180 [Klebsiella pneumoniae]